jgi:hypothetical protein
MNSIEARFCLYFSLFHQERTTSILYSTLPVKIVLSQVRKDRDYHQVQHYTLILEKCILQASTSTTIVSTQVCIGNTHGAR